MGGCQCQVFVHRSEAHLVDSAHRALSFKLFDPVGQQGCVVVLTSELCSKLPLHDIRLIPVAFNDLHDGLD